MYTDQSVLTITVAMAAYLNMLHDVATKLAICYSYLSSTNENK